MRNTVRLTAFNPAWPKRYQEEATKIRAALGTEAEGIEHFGSTVLGIAAKPIIDILVGVRQLPVTAERLIEPFAKLGYLYIPKPEHPDRWFFRRGEPGRGEVHVHVVEYGGAEWRNKLLFRDYLLAVPAAKERYLAEKERLAEVYAEDRKAYTEAKTTVISQLLTEAREWQLKAQKSP